MPAYWIARAKINDPVEYKKYTDRAGAIVVKFGGRILARGGKFRIMEGTHKYHRFVVVEFPSLEQAAKCHASPEYQEAAAFRRAAGVSEVEQAIVEGGDATKESLIKSRSFSLLRCHSMSETERG